VAEETQDQAAGAAHEEKHGARKGEEGFHGRGTARAICSARCRVEGFRHEFAEGERAGK